MATAVGFPAKDLKEEDLGDWEQLAVTARCLRCGGLMVIEPCFDFPASRCVQCGEVIDTVILRNRRRIGRDDSGFKQW